MREALAVFEAEVRRADEQVNLGRAALLIAQSEYPELPLGTYLELLDELAAGAAARLPAEPEPREVAQAVSRHLFHEMEFRGNSDDYYDPRNSYLNDVLLRRRGIPISLSVLYLEVARRLGLRAAGVSFPQHFLVKFDDQGQEWFVDPFHQGEEFAGPDLRQAILGRGNIPEESLDYYLSAATRRQMLTRMLVNLKAVYSSRQDWVRALRVQEYLLAISPWSFEEIRDRGVLRARTGNAQGALADLETYLQYAGDAADAESVRRMMERIRAGG